MLVQTFLSFCTALFLHISLGGSMKKVILLTGIHGVGKSYILNSIKEKISIPIYTASYLIRKNGNKSDFNKKVLNIRKNQEYLSYAIENFVKEDKFILDGHTCLWNEKLEIEKIDFNNLKKIDVCSVIFIYDEVGKIKCRLYKRDQQNYSYNILDQFQKTEFMTSKELSKQLQIPFFCFKSTGDLNILINYIQKIEVIL